MNAKSCDDSGKEFIMCALDPFGADSARVPDGRGGMSTHVKYTAATSFTVRSGAQTACVAAFPNLPGGLILVDGAFNLVDRGGTSRTLSVVPGGDNVIVPFPDLYQSSSTSLVFGNVGNVSRCRVVSYGLEVKPVGAILQQGGVFATANFPTNISETAIPEYMDAGTHLGVSITGGGITQCRSMAQIPQTYGQLQAYPGVQMCSGTESCRLVGKPAAYSYSQMEVGTHQGALMTDMTTFVNGWLPVTFSGTAPVTVGGSEIGTNGTPRVLTGLMPLSGDLSCYSSFWYDKNCDGLIWAAQDLSADMAFEVRFHLCVEIQISHITSIYRPFISKAPREDPKAMAIVDEVQRQMPPSLPAPNTSSDWWSNITSAVIGVGDLAASLEIPIVSQVGALASRFAKMLG